VLHVARIEKRRVEEAVAAADLRARALLEHACPTCEAPKGNSCFNRYQGRKLGTKVCEARLALVGAQARADDSRARESMNACFDRHRER
jgi:hypothetical protein